MYKNINSVIKINNLKKIIIESSSLYELNENIIDDTCCLCLELLNKKTCYECKNCHKGYCLQNDTCSGLIENIKYRTTCPNCIECFIKTEALYSIYLYKKINNKEEQQHVINWIKNANNDIIKTLEFINNIL